MIGQYLSNKNKSATVTKSKKFLDPSDQMHIPLHVFPSMEYVFAKRSRRFSARWRPMLSKTRYVCAP